MSWADPSNQDACWGTLSASLILWPATEAVGVWTGREIPGRVGDFSRDRGGGSPILSNSGECEMLRERFREGDRDPETGGQGSRERGTEMQSENKPSWGRDSGREKGALTQM